MIKYEFMRAHGKGSEGSEKGGGVRKKGGAKKRGNVPHPLFSKRGGARSTGTTPVYATDDIETVCSVLGAQHLRVIP